MSEEDPAGILLVYFIQWWISVGVAHKRESIETNDLEKELV